MTHDDGDGVELTFDNIVNDSSLRLHGSDVPNRIEKNLFVSENRI